MCSQFLFIVCEMLFLLCARRPNPVLYSPFVLLCHVLFALSPHAFSLSLIGKIVACKLCLEKNCIHFVLEEDGKHLSGKKFQLCHI